MLIATQSADGRMPLSFSDRTCSIHLTYFPNLCRLSATKAVVIVSHSEAVRKIAHVVYTIENGALVQ